MLVWWMIWKRKNSWEGNWGSIVWKATGCVMRNKIYGVINSSEYRILWSSGPYEKKNAQV